MGKKYIVTGSAGFIGSHLVEKLINQGHEVIGIDNLSNGINKHSQLNFIEADVQHMDYSCFRHTDGVFHLAAQGSVPRSIENPDSAYVNNIDGFWGVLRACEHYSVPRVVFASSSSVYGDSKALPKVEDTIGRQLSPYSVSKLTNELMASVSPVKTVGLRFFNVYGSRQRHDINYPAVIPKWINNMRNGEQVEIHGDGNAFRDFTHVSDVVQALCLSMDTELENPSEIFNVGTGRYTTLNELLAHIRNEIGLGKAETMVSWDTENQPLIPQSIASIQKAMNLLGYKPETNIIDGLSETCRN